MTLTGELSGDPGDLPRIYSESIGPFRDILIELTEVQNSGHEVLTVYSRHADAVAKTLSAHCDASEGSRPTNPADIRKYMTQEMTSLWDFRDFLVDDLNFYDAEIFRAVISDCTVQVRTVIYSELNSIRRNVQALADSIRAAWDDLSDRESSSKQRVKSRAEALQCLRDVAQGWLTLSEELASAAGLWRREGSA